MQVIIMAGGEGSRLRPLTCDRPKPMVPLVNKPVMEHTVDLLKNNGWTDIGVTLQYMPQNIMHYFGDGTEFGTNMKYFIEESPLGTAGSVKNASGFLKETFLVISGDALTDFDLEQALAFHRQNGSWATLILKQVNIPLEYGVVITSKNGGITRFLEKPGWGEVFSDTVNTGIYILEPQVLDYIPDKTKFDFSKDLFPLLMKERKPMYGFLSDGYWCDIGSLEQYQQANIDILLGRAVISGVKEQKIRDDIWFGENVQISREAQVTAPVIIGSNTVIEKGAVVGPFTVIGPNCRIGRLASIKRSILWDGATVGSNAQVKGAVLCSQVNIKERGSAFEGAVLGDRVTVENMATVRPSVKIWPDKTVGKETVVKDNVVWGQFSTKNVFGVAGISGLTNVEILPEKAARVGAAFGAAFGPGHKILVSFDGAPGNKMVKLALASGLQSVGCQVIDIGQVPVTVHRFGIRQTGAKGGIHVEVGSSERNTVIRLFDHRGVPISRNMERKIESNLQREDFPRAEPAKVGDVKKLPGIHDRYIDELLRYTNVEALRRRQPKIVYLTRNGTLDNILQPTMERLGCRVVYTAPNPMQTGEAGELLHQLREKVLRERADLGVLLDPNGESLHLLDELGREFGKENYPALMAAVLLNGYDARKVAVPVTVPGLVERIAQQINGQVLRTKSSPQQYLDELLKEELVREQQRMPQHLVAFDGVAGLVSLMNFLSVSNMQLSTFLDSLPKAYNTKKSINCNWEDKGKVMRALIQEHADRDVELIDGIKIFDQKGWALVLPDIEEPLYHVYSEGTDFEAAESLADFYIDKIKKLTEGKEGI